MAVSGPVVVAILVAALLTEAGTVVTAQRNADTLSQQAQDLWQRRHEAMLQESLRFDNASWDNISNQVTLKLTNAGTVTLNATRVDVLLDGALADSAVTSRQVAGVASGVWPQGSELVLVVQAQGKPGDAAVLTQYGLQAVWRGV